MFPGSLFTASFVVEEKDPGSGWVTCLPKPGRHVRGGNVGFVIFARKGISTHLILWPDDHRENVSRQGILCTTHTEFDVKGKKLSSNRSDATENILASFDFIPV